MPDGSPVAIVSQSSRSRLRRNGHSRLHRYDRGDALGFRRRLSRRKRLDLAAACFTFIILASCAHFTSMRLLGELEYFGANLVSAVHLHGANLPAPSIPPLPESLMTCRREISSANGVATANEQLSCAYYRPISFFKEGMPGFPHRHLLDSGAKWDTVPYWEHVSWGHQDKQRADTGTASLTYLNVPKSGSTTMTNALKQFAIESSGRFRRGGGCCHGRPASSNQKRSKSARMEAELAKTLRFIQSSQEEEKSNFTMPLIDQREMLAPPRHFLFTILRDPVSRFVSSTRHVLSLRESARKGIGVKFQQNCGCAWHRVGAKESKRQGEREFGLTRKGVRRGRANKPNHWRQRRRRQQRQHEPGYFPHRMLSTVNLGNKVNYTAADILRCTLSFLKEYGLDVDVHFQPSATRIHGQYLQGINVSVAVFRMDKHLGAILTALGYNPDRKEQALGTGRQSVWSSMTKTEQSVFGGLSAHDLDDSMIRDICDDLYKVDVDLWHYLGYTVPFCD